MDKIGDRMSKKGFTMIELLAAIVILGVLSVIAIGSVTRLGDKAREEDKESYKKALKMAAESYMQANKNKLPRKIGSEVVVQSTELKEKRYLKEDKGGCVEVVKNDKTDYEYKVKKNCGVTCRDTDGPQIEVYFTDASDEIISANEIKDLKNASLHVDIAPQVKNGKTIPISGYSYSILAQAVGDTEMGNAGGDAAPHEVFNSGTLSARGRNQIKISRKIKDYIDITGLTNFNAKVEALDEAGCKQKATAVKGTNDIDDPYCLSNKSGEGKEWINKLSKETSRTITVNCEDGNGSGCIRPTFTRTWPNDEQKDAEYAYIQVSDNAKNKNIGDTPIKAKNVCEVDPLQIDTNNTCRVSVKIDRTLPTIEVEGVYAVNADGKMVEKNIGTNLITVNDTTAEGKGIGTISANQYNKLFNGWMNKDNYPSGVMYKIKVSDNIHLDSWEWKTNAAYITNPLSNEYKKYSAKNDRYKKTVDKSQKYYNKDCGQKSEEIIIGFNKEGRRKGELTVKDKAGNVTTLYIEADLDRTSPLVPEVTYKNYKPTAAGNWSKTKYAKASVYDTNGTTNERDLRADLGKTKLNAALSGWDHFEYTLVAHYDSKKSRTDARGGELEFTKNYEGRNTISFRSIDKAGNRSAYSTPTKVWVDYTIPECGVTRNPTEASKLWVGLKGGTGPAKNTIVVTAKCLEGDENNSQSGCAGDKVFSHEYNAEAKRSDGGARGYKKGGFVIDKAGNTKDCPANQKIYLDYTIPSYITSGEPKVGAWTQKGRTITRTCSDNKGTVNSGCVKSYQQKGVYDKDGKTYKTDNKTFVAITIYDKAGNLRKVSAYNMPVYVDKQKPSCSSEKTHKHTTSGVTITYSCSDHGGSGVVNCPRKDHKFIETGVKSDRNNKVRDGVGNSISCNVNVTPYKQYKYIKKNVPKRCTNSCCGTKTCTKGSCCGYNTARGANCAKCGSKSWSKTGHGYCPSGISGWSCSSRWISTNYLGHGGSCKTSCNGCKTCTWKTGAKRCTKACCGYYTCTSGRCCGYACGSQWTGWGAHSTGCRSTYRWLYK